MIIDYLNYLMACIGYALAFSGLAYVLVYTLMFLVNKTIGYLRLLSRLVVK